MPKMLSELIWQLSEIFDESGDLPVYAESCDHGDLIDIAVSCLLESPNGKRTCVIIDSLEPEELEDDLT